MLGTESTPLRVAIIGSGPSGFYTADALFKHEDKVIQIDMFDRLPTPHGLVRGGVAPDHPKIKSVSKVYDKTASNPNFRFYGYVEIGKDIKHEELKSYYHAIIYAVGAQTDRHLGIPGENLSGSHAATEFVAWYNAHPDYCDLSFDLSQKAAVVVGNGNVAMDVVRILASSYDELHQTDIADYALNELQHSNVHDIYMLGRRGPVQAAFTNPELKELGELTEVDIIVDPKDLELDPLSRAALDAHPDATVDKNLHLLAEYANRPIQGKRKRIHLMFLASPVELLGTEHVEAVKIVHNELQASPDGSLRPRATDQFLTIQAGLVFRSIGYMGVPIVGVPFDQKTATIPNDKGRVLDVETRQPVPGVYVVGWIKRGPSGIIGTNKPDAGETVTMLMEDLPNLPKLEPMLATRQCAEELIRSRKPNFVSYEDWLLLDKVEREQGAQQSRPRIKFSRVPEMLDAIKRAKGL